MAGDPKANDRKARGAATATVLCPDLAINCLGRAHVLASLLEPEHTVRIVGPCSKPEIWAPLRGDRRFQYVAVPCLSDRGPAARDAWRRVAQELAGDLVYVSKPFATSLWAARKRPNARGARLVLDIDDWERGFLRQQLDKASLRGKLNLLAQTGLYHRKAWNVLAGDRLAKLVATRTVSNRFLQKRFGGTIVWHARDADEFDPARWDGAVKRQAFRIPADRKVVLFLGTPRAHKGIEDLVDAMDGLAERRALLVVVGVDQDAYAQRMAASAKARLGDRVLLLPPQPFADAPALLAMADVAAIPQRDDPVALGQMPAKVFDAMAMETPVVATAVSDLPEVLAGGAGRIVPPRNPAALRTALADVLASPDEAHAMARRARARFVASYSLAAMRATLRNVLQA